MVEANDILSRAEPGTRWTSRALAACNYKMVANLLIETSAR